MASKRDGGGSSEEEYESEYESETNKQSSVAARSRRTAGVVSQGLVNNKYVDDRPVPYRKPPEPT